MEKEPRKISRTSIDSANCVFTTRSNGLLFHEPNLLTVHEFESTGELFMSKTADEDKTPTLGTYSAIQ